MTDEEQSGEAPLARPTPRALWFVDLTVRYGRWIWLVALLVAVPATWRTVHLYLGLKSELEELLPRGAPSALALDELRERIPGLQYLGVVVDVGDASKLPAGERFVDDLAARIRTYPRTIVRGVRTGSSEERTFLEDHAPLYVALPDLRRIREQIEARRDWEVAHETGTSLEDDTPPPLDFGDIEHKYEAKIPKRGDGQGDRYSSQELHTTVMLVEIGEFQTGTAAGRHLMQRVREDIAALGGTDAYAPGMRFGFSGDIAISVEELDSLISDLAVSSTLVIIAVIAVIVIYYRWARSVLVLLPPLLLATVLAFAIASLPPFNVNQLNSNTAFLGAIIVGNGINFGIVLLARYVEERRRETEVRDALAIAVSSARIGTLSAALGAGAAYASLISTQFRGFRQFGIIGGIGMVLSWAVAFVCMPPLIVWLDRNGRVTRSRPRAASFTNAVAHVVLRHPLPVLGIGMLLTGIAIARVSTFGADEIETDFSKLRRRDTRISGERYWGEKMDAVLGRYLTPTVILADSVAQASAIGAKVREEAARPPLAELVSEIRTLDDVVPPHQPEKVIEVAAIRDDMTPKMRSLLTPERREQLDRLLGDEDPKPFTLSDVPRTFTTALVERDGSAGRTVLVFPRPSKGWWEGPRIISFTNMLRSIAATGGDRPARVAGSLPLSADIIGSIQRDGLRTSAIAFLGVIAVVVAMLRRHVATIYVIASLAIAVLWLTAATMFLGVKINFANFIAFPITFGIGVDYAVNVVSRYVQDGRKDIGSAVRATGSAVALCSLTTSIGYSSLLVAANRALFLFGVVAVLGELACITTALTLLPAFLQLLEHARLRAEARRA